MYAQREVNAHNITSSDAQIIVIPSIQYGYRYNVIYVI